ncbi:signal peptidase II [Ruminococcus sp. Marseille-P6503]|uniref:signal peptidase II n=1 Tax=Ruminococcus sp. Marseille-P6503 TaxID=2364796 RepID=UPI000F53CACB|nr:signal peptidase II [Ruminococcus sp. Marseille-P6503]
MFIISLAIIAVLTAIDQLIKFAVVKNIEIGEIIKVVKFGSHDILSLTHITNDGAAWSIMSGKTWFLIGIPVAVIIAALVYMYKKRGGSRLQTISLSLVIAGGIGNLIDRIRIKEVVDYILFEPIDFPIFNFADICVVVGAVLFCIYIIFLEGKGQKYRSSESETEKADNNEQA